MAANDTILRSIYYDPKHPASFSTAQRLYEAARHQATLTRQDVNDWLKGEFTYTLHRPVRHNFQRNPIICQNKDEQWEADLVEMREFSRDNNKYNYLLTVIDCLTKYAWAVPLMTKTSKDVLEAFKKIFRQGRQPNCIRTDQGKEFLNSKLQTYLRQQQIYHFTSKSTIKCAIVERFNRTLKQKMFKYFTSRGTRKWIDVINDILLAYNSARHRSIKMTPQQASKVDDDRILFENIHGTRDWKSLTSSKRLTSVKDSVRKKYERRPFDKSYYPNWTDQIFHVNSSSKSDPRQMHKLDNDNGRRYYPEELQQVRENLFRVEKILRRRRGRRNVKEVFVKWLNYPSTYNEWIPESDIVRL